MLGRRARRRGLFKRAGDDLDGQPCVTELKRLEPGLNGPGKGLGRATSGSAEHLHRRAERRPGFGKRDIERREVGVVALEGGELGLDRVAMRGELIRLAAKPAGESAIVGQARLDLFE